MIVSMSSSVPTYTTLPARPCPYRYRDQATAPLSTVHPKRTGGSFTLSYGGRPLKAQLLILNTGVNGYRDLGADKSVLKPALTTRLIRSTCSRRTVPRIPVSSMMWCPLFRSSGQSTVRWYTLLSTMPLGPAYLPLVILTRSPRRPIHLMDVTVGSGHAVGEGGDVSFALCTTL